MYRFTEGNRKILLSGCAHNGILNILDRFRELFGGAPDVYHVQLLQAPEGFSFDPDFEMYTDAVYGEWVLRIRNDG